MPNRVHYPNFRFEGGPGLSVDCLGLDEALTQSAPMNDLIVDAYSHTYERLQGRIRLGAFAARYGIPEATERRRTYISGLYKRGGGYLVVRDWQDSGKLLAALKYLPGEAAEERFAGHVGLAEILSRPARSGGGLARALLHAWLKHTNLPKEAQFVSEVIDGGYVGPWLGRLGCKQEQTADPLVIEEGQELSSHYYVSGEGVTIDTMVQLLEQRQAALITADKL